MKMFWNKEPEEIERFIFLNEDQQNVFCSNEVITSKYTMWDFIPKNIIEQFHKLSNIYFLLIAIFQCLPQITVTSGVPTLAMPLIIVFLISGIKDAYEDWQRHKSDLIENNKITHFIPNQWKSKNEKENSILFMDYMESKNLYEEEVKNEVDELYNIGLGRYRWKDVKVGQLIVCKNRDIFPADLILLTSSNTHGLAFIETVSLDGETNLKVKQANKKIYSIISGSKKEVFENASQIRGNLICTPPSKDLFLFNGTLTVENSSIQKNMNADNNKLESERQISYEASKSNFSKSELLKISVTSQQLLLRGCKLRNTDWIVGLTVYTGKETKIQKNSTKPLRKTSKVERLTNRLTLFIWTVQLVVCIIAAIYSTNESYKDDHKSRRYLLLDNYKKLNPFVAGLINFLTWVVLTCNFVPISLIVTMGMVKTIQAYFIMSDENMYNQETDTYACARASDLNEELGMVEYIFSDKTGTLTSNVMEFKKCYVNGIAYGENSKEHLSKNLFDSKTDFLWSKTPHVNLNDESLHFHVRDIKHRNHASLIDFFLHLSVNHSVVPEVDEKGYIRYSASSPDEGALVYGAKHFGVEFKARTPYGVEVNVLEKTLKIDVLATMEFTSNRMRSSILCRIPKSDGSYRIVLFCKGADTVLQERLKNFGSKEEKTLNAMLMYASDGLRTLCISKRDLTNDEFSEWFSQYEEASLSLENRNEKLEELANQIEKDLILQGVTGIEDRLQEKVGETIESLLKAGIHVWMLTGDKIETSINIGMAAKLLRNNMQRHIFEWNSKNGIDSDTLLNRLNKIVESIESDKKKGDDTMQNAAIIDGETLNELLKDKLQKSFVDLCRNCETILCCRVTPHQKGAVVSLIKKYENKITLAIGDGANDCNMIQSAHVGIGLRGKEGLQAFNTSDYGLSKFCFLKYLLLVHGRWSYRRITHLVLYVFYKNIVLVMPIFYFGILSLFSGQKIYFEFLYQMYNVVFTSIPIIIYGVLDQDVDKITSLKYPCLYKLGQSNYYFNNITFLIWIFKGIYHSFIIFILALYGFSYFTIPTSNGRPFDLWIVGMVIFTFDMFIVNFKVLLETSYITLISILGVTLSLLGYFFFLFLFSSWPNFAGTILGSAFIMASSFYFWICFFLSLIATIGVDWFLKCVKKNFFPEIYHYIQEKEYGKKAVSNNNLKKKKTKKSNAIKFPPNLYSYEGNEIKNEKDSLHRLKSHRGFAFSEADEETLRILREENFSTVIL